MKWGAQISNGGPGTIAPPPLATALYVATFTAKSNEIAPSYEI